MLYNYNILLYQYKNLNKDIQLHNGKKYQKENNENEQHHI